MTQKYWQLTQYIKSYVRNKLGRISYEDLPMSLEQAAVVCEVLCSLFKMSSTVNFELTLAIVECNKSCYYVLYISYMEVKSCYAYVITQLVNVYVCE